MADNDPHAQPFQQPDTSPKTKQSIGDLIASISDQSSRLAKAEIAALKAEFKTKAALSGAAIGMFAAAGVLALFGLGYLLWAAFSGLSVVFAPWLSALILAAVLFAVVAVLALVGQKLLKKNSPPVPTQAIANLKQDIAAIKGGIK